MQIFYSIVLIVIGAFFTTSGFQVFFRQMYSMINNYERLKLRYKDPEGYARRLGLIQFVGGLAEFICGIVSLILRQENLGMILLCATVVPVFIAMMINDNAGLK